VHPTLPISEYPGMCDLNVGVSRKAAKESSYTSDTVLIPDHKEGEAIHLPLKHPSQFFLSNPI